MEKCGSDSTWIRRRPTAENAPNTAMVMCPCLAPARYTTGMNNAHMAMDMFSAHLGGGCGSSDGIVSIIWKYSRADKVAVIDMTAVQTQPPKMMEPRPKKERTSAEVIRSWSLPMDTLGLTMPCVVRDGREGGCFIVRYVGDSEDSEEVESIGAGRKTVLTQAVGESG